MVRALDRETEQDGEKVKVHSESMAERARDGGKVKACLCQNVKPRKRQRQQRGRDQNNICKLFDPSFTTAFERERSIVPAKCAEKIIQYTFTITGKISMRHV